MNLNEVITYKEIKQQINVWPTLKDYIMERKKEFIKIFEDEINKNQNVLVIFTGAGTSAYIGDVLEEYLEDYQNVEFRSVPTTDIVLSPEKYLLSNKKIILINFARSGNSPETQGVVKLADQLNKEIIHVFITNNKDGYLAKYEGEAVKFILPEKTNDQSLAMTSSFSSMLITAAYIFDKEISTKFFEELPHNFDEIESFVERIVEKDFKRVFYVGSGIHSKIILETSLKMNELNAGLLPVNNESTLGFRHGPKAALIDDSLFIQLYSGNEYKNNYEIDITNEVGAPNNYYKVLLVPDKSITKKINQNEFEIYSYDGSYMNEFEKTLIYLIFGQLLACMKSILNGINPDNPSPDGFINRVVKGVEIYEFKGGRNNG